VRGERPETARSSSLENPGHLATSPCQRHSDDNDTEPMLAALFSSSATASIQEETITFHRGGLGGKRDGELRSWAPPRAASMRLQQRSRQEADEEVDAMLCHAMSVLSYAVAALRTMLPHTVHRPCPPRTVALCRPTVLHATYCTVQYVLGIEIARVCIAASSGPGDCQDTATDRKLLGRELYHYHYY
jgi:hypothetical protein